MLQTLFVLCLFFPVAYSGVGEILTIRGGQDAKILRQGSSLGIGEKTELEEGDTILTGNSHVVFLIYPKVQMSLNRGSELKISEHLLAEVSEANRSSSVVELVKGIIRVQVLKDDGEEIEQKIQSGAVAFSVRGTEYEVSATEEAAELDVLEGEVVVSSPHVQTFVPEVVKPNEGFRFSRKARKFERRKFRLQMKEAHLLKKEKIRELARERKKKRQVLREERKDKRLKKRTERKERRERKGRSR